MTSDILAEQRSAIELLLQDAAYSTEQLAELWSEYDGCLRAFAEKQQPNQEYASILAENLQWVDTITAKINADRDELGQLIHRLIRGKNASKSYGANL